MRGEIIWGRSTTNVRYDFYKPRANHIILNNTASASPAQGSKIEIFVVCEEANMFGERRDPCQSGSSSSSIMSAIMQCLRVDVTRTITVFPKISALLGTNTCNEKLDYIFCVCWDYTEFEDFMKNEPYYSIRRAFLT
jgi:hypothetical protein